MKYICAQPATQYFGWQIDVMLHSFITTGVDLKDVHVVCAIHNEISDYFETLKAKYPKVIFEFYEDKREKKNYISSIRPHILKQHWEKHPYLKNETVFYHDCDIALTKPLDLSNMLDGDTCYLSDTISYIGHDYILSKGEIVLDEMCKIVNIPKELVRQNQKNSGGAQYIIKNIDWWFWQNVEYASENLFTKISLLNKNLKKEKGNDYHEIQIWCADMWAVLWNLWLINKKTKVAEELDFLWSTSNISDWHKNSIYHNAGVTAKSEGLFFKGKYINEMPDLKLNESLDKTKCSYNYYLLIKQAL